MKKLFLVIIALTLLATPSLAAEFVIDPGYSIIYTNNVTSHEICAYVDRSVNPKYAHITDMLVQGYVSRPDVFKINVYFKTRFAGKLYGKSREDSQWRNLFDQTRNYDFSYEWIKKISEGQNVFVPRIGTRDRDIAPEDFETPFFRFMKMWKIQPYYIGAPDSRHTFSVQVPIERLVERLWYKQQVLKERDICGVCTVISTDAYESPDFFVVFTVGQDIITLGDRRYYAAEIINGGEQVFAHEQRPASFSENVYGSTLAVTWPRIDRAKYYKVELHSGFDRKRAVATRTIEDPDNVSYWSNLLLDENYSWRLAWSPDNDTYSYYTKCRNVDLSNDNLLEVARDMNWEELVELGLEYFGGGDYVAALAEFMNALKIDPNNHIINNNLGRVYEVLGDYEIAADYYRKAIAMCPHSAEAHNNLAFILYRANDLKNALTEWEIVYSIDPIFPNVKNNIQFTKRKIARLGETPRPPYSYSNTSYE